MGRRTGPVTPLIRVHLVFTAAAIAIVGACDDSSNQRVGSLPKRGASDDTNSVARKVGEIQDLHAPESVKYDSSQDVFFISNIQGAGSNKDGHGFIARVPASDYGDVTIFAQSGKGGVQLNAPKGMAIQGDTLWVADIDVVRGFHRRTGAPVATVDLAGHNAVLLNDVAIGPDGALYLTDTGIIMSEKGVLHPGGEKIFRLAGRLVEVLPVSPPISWPNGITWDAREKRWLVVTFDPFASELNAIGQGSNARTKIGSGIGRFDGVEVMGDGRVLVSAWVDSSIHVFADGKDERIIRHLSQPADIGLDTRRNRVAIPLVMMDRVQFWQIAPRNETFRSRR
jgi:sugar lactone lactonase YvrE